MATVAVIIPMYSYAEYLDEAIQSVLNQSQLPDEIICVSDGSIDSSVKIARKYPVTVIEKKNGGLASARNAGIRVSTSDYIMSFDSDDIMRPDCIKEHMKLAAPNTIVTMPLIAFGSENYTARPKHASLEVLKKGNVIYSNSLFPRELWKRVGGFDESETMRLGLEDYLYWLECAKAGAEFVTGDYPSLLWRRHARTMSDTSANPNWNKITSYIKQKIG